MKKLFVIGMVSLFPAVAFADAVETTVAAGKVAVGVGALELARRAGKEMTAASARKHAVEDIKFNLEVERFHIDGKPEGITHLSNRLSNQHKAKEIQAKKLNLNSDSYRKLNKQIVVSEIAEEEHYRSFEKARFKMLSVGLVGVAGLGFGVADYFNGNRAPAMIESKEIPLKDAPRKAVRIIEFEKSELLSPQGE